MFTDSVTVLSASSKYPCDISNKNIRKRREQSCLFGVSGLVALHTLLAKHHVETKAVGTNKDSPDRDPLNKNGNTDYMNNVSAGVKRLTQH